MHETGILINILYVMCGASIAGFVIYLQHKAGHLIEYIRNKYISKKQEPPIEWD
jgi:hypothetical protein